MIFRTIPAIFGLIVLWPGIQAAGQAVSHEIVIATPKMAMTLDYGGKASIVSLVINGKKVIGSEDGMYTAVTVGASTYSSLGLKGKPVMEQDANRIVLRGIRYGNEDLTITETWTFLKKGESIEWAIDRAFSKAAMVNDAAMPVMNFDDINTWEGAYQGYGGLAWFFLFNEKLCTYGVHTHSASFWNSKSGDGLKIAVDAPGRKVAMKYSRTPENRLGYTVTVADRDLLPLADSGTNRRRFIRKGTTVWAPFSVGSGESIQRLTFRYFD